MDGVCEGDMPQRDGSAEISGEPRVLYIASGEKLKLGACRKN